MSFHVIITTYNRPEMLRSLLEQIETERERHRISVQVYDDCSDLDYSWVRRFNVRYHHVPVHRGKPQFWKTINAAFQRARRYDFRYFVQLPDDVSLIPDFFDRAVTAWDGINDPRKICLNLLLDEGRRRTPCWTSVKPRTVHFQNTSADLTQWIDCAMFSERACLEALGFGVNRVSPARFRRDPMISSGVGRQLSHRLYKAGFNLYRVPETLLIHGEHPSVMHPEPDAIAA